MPTSFPRGCRRALPAARWGCAGRLRAPAAGPARHPAGDIAHDAGGAHGVAGIDDPGLPRRAHARRRVRAGMTAKEFILDSKPHWAYTTVEQDSVGHCITIAYASLADCHTASEHGLRGHSRGIEAYALWEMVEGDSDVLGRPSAARRVRNSDRHAFHVMGGCGPAAR